MSYIDGNYYGDMGTLGDYAGCGGSRGGGSDEDPSWAGTLLLLVLCVLIIWGMFKYSEKTEARHQTCLQRHTELWCDDNYGDDGLKSDKGLNLHAMIEENK